MCAFPQLLGIILFTWRTSFSEASVLKPISCAMRASDLTDVHPLVVCPPNCTPWQHSVFGSEVYASVSSVCGAARHRGVITTSGGPVKVTKLPGQENYLSSYSNGVKSQRLSKWISSFTVSRAEVQPLEVVGQASTTALPVADQPAQKVLKKNPKKNLNVNQDCQVDVALLLDGSYNIGQRRFNLQKMFVSKLVQLLRIGREGPHVGVVQASEKPVTEFYLKNYTHPKELVFAIKEIIFRGGNTNTGKAIMHTVETFFSTHYGVRRGLPRVIMAFVDGWPTDDLEEAATRARESGINVFMVTVAKPVAEELSMVQDKNFMERAVCKNNTFFNFNMSSWFSNNKHLRTLAERLCSTEEMLCSKTCYNSVNLAFLIDGSSSVGHHNFRMMLDFIKGVAGAFEISEVGSRVAAVQFTYDQRTEFDFNRHAEKEPALAAVTAIQYMSGGTATGDAINYVVSNLFASRKTGKNFLVVITDGQSYDDITEPALHAQKEGITIYSVGVAWAPLDDLRAMASEPKERHTFFTREFSGLQQFQQNVVKGICRDFTDA